MTNDESREVFCPPTTTGTTTWAGDPATIPMPDGRALTLAEYRDALREVVDLKGATWAQRWVEDDVPALIAALVSTKRELGIGVVARCSEGRPGLITGRTALPWGLSWTGIALDARGGPWASRCPTPLSDEEVSALEIPTERAP